MSKDSGHDRALLAAYGEAVFVSHLIEDLLRLHLMECAYFKINNFSEAESACERAMFNKLIPAYEKLYSKSKEPNFAKLIGGLKKIQKIRNCLAHGFIHQIHAELYTEEGREQTIAMLKRVAVFERGFLKLLGIQHEAIVKVIRKKHLMELLRQPDRPITAGLVATSEIQVYLNELEAIIEGPNKKKP